MTAPNLIVHGIAIRPQYDVIMCEMAQNTPMSFAISCLLFDSIADSSIILHRILKNLDIATHAGGDRTSRFELSSTGGHRQIPSLSANLDFKEKPK
jgi:hypothetical protein